MTKQELEKRVAELEREVAELKARPVQEYHYHYHYGPRPYVPTYYPTWPVQPFEPYRVTCKPINPIGDTITFNANDAAPIAYLPQFKSDNGAGLPMVVTYRENL